MCFWGKYQVFLFHQDSVILKKKIKQNHQSSGKNQDSVPPIYRDSAGKSECWDFKFRCFWGKHQVFLFHQDSVILKKKNQTEQTVNSKKSGFRAAHFFGEKKSIFGRLWNSVLQKWGHASMPLNYVFLEKKSDI